MSLTPDSGTTRERPPEGLAHDAATGGLTVSPDPSSVESSSEPSSVDEPASANEAAQTLGGLPVGARLILRCRADWRAATVAFLDAAGGRVVLNVASPGGHTYRVRRPADSALEYDGHLPVLGRGSWRAGLARYDVRW